MNNKLEKTYNYIGFLICFSIPFMTYAKAFVNICMICLFLILVVLPNKQKALEIIKNNFFKTFLIFLLFVTLFTVFNSSFFLDFSETRKIAQIALLFILFSFVNDKRLLIYGFILGVLISSLITGINIINYYLNSFALLIAVVVFLTTIIHELKPQHSFLLIVGAVLIFSSIIYTNKNLSNRFFYSEDSIRSSFIDKIKTHEPRYDIWKFSGQIFKEEKPYFFGIGTFKTQELLVSKYKLMPIEKRKNWFIERNFNTHNQYIDIAISYGIIGLLIFLVFVKEIVKFSFKNIHSLNLVISLLLFLIVENIFHRQLGSFIFALTLVLALFLIKSKNEKNINS